MSIADELDKLVSLREKGILTEAEFEAEKSKVLAGDRDRKPTEPEPTKQEKKKSPVLTGLLVVAGLVGAFLLFGATVGNTPEARARDADREAIELCWGEQQRKSLDPGSQRFIAGACEKMEKDFENRWGRKP